MFMKYLALNFLQNSFLLDIFNFSYILQRYFLEKKMDINYVPQVFQSKCWMIWEIERARIDVI
jgi:hypothetical protein